MWLCPKLVCEGLELAPRAIPRGREPKHSLLEVLGEEGETFIGVGEFFVPTSPTKISTLQVCELRITSLSSPLLVVS